ncbi:hypothetical protein EV363DRAFT_1143328, partial [Boletus edulis]
IPFIRSFHSSALQFGVLLQCGTLILPLEPCEPKSMCQVWAALRCAEREAGVGAMRVKRTFLWMSDP